MRRVALGFVAVLGILALNQTFAHEVQNGGGAVVVNGTSYELADLHFKTRADGRVDLSPKMREKLEKIALFLNQGLMSPLRDENSNEFFSAHVFAPEVEYLLVDQLPENCSAAGLSDSESFEMIACTQGSISWLRVEPYSKLSFVDQAYLIIHERLHALAPLEPYEVKADFVRSLHYLMEAYLPLRDKVQNYFLKNYELPKGLKEFYLGEQRWKALARFSRRVTQLSAADAQARTQVYFNRQGALFLQGDCEESFLLTRGMPFPIHKLGSATCNYQID